MKMLIVINQEDCGCRGHHAEPLCGIVVDVAVAINDDDTETESKIRELASKLQRRVLVMSPAAVDTAMDYLLDEVAELEHDMEDEPQATETPHEADAWIGEQWMGKKVREVSGTCNLGRTGTVVEVITDENGKLHCRSEFKTDRATWDHFWCPAACLIIADDEVSRGSASFA